MRTYSSWLTFWIIGTNIAWCVAGLVEYSQNFNGSDSTITSFQGITIGECERKCEERAKCKSAKYYRLTHYCVLTPLVRDEQPMMPEVGTTLLSGFHPAYQPNLKCDGVTCSTNETCIVTSSGNRMCKLKECDKPVADHVEFLGNRYSVGSKQVDICSFLDVQITCNQSGQWIPSENLMVRDCNDVCGKSGIYTTSPMYYCLYHTSVMVRDCNDVCGTSGIYTTSGLQVYCDMDTDKGHWLVFQRREDGSETFERNWSDYRDGFGSLNGEFWLGNALLHHILGNGDYELRIDLDDWYGNQRYASYSSFSISSEADNYRLAVTGYSGDAGNSFNMNGYMFSTLDVDNDVYSGSCASLYRGGWWYSACHSSNLNGLYEQGGNTTMYAKTAVWSAWHGHYYSLKITEMKIRRKR